MNDASGTGGAAIENTTFLLSSNGNNASTPLPKVYESLDAFHRAYEQWHPFIALPICVVGVIMNVLYMIVLGQKHMRTSTNCMLFVIAACDLLLMVSYFVHCLHQFVLHRHICDEYRQSFPWVAFTLTHAHLTYTLYGISTWLTIALAGYRCKILRSKRLLPTRHKSLTSLNADDVRDQALPYIVGVSLFVFIASLPYYISHGIDPIEKPSRHCMWQNRTTKQYKVGESTFSKNNESKPMTIAFWTASIIFKIAPSILLTLFIILLIVTVAQQRVKQKRLLSTQRKNSNCALGDRLSSVLICILTVFLITQMPQGVLTLLSVMLRDQAGQRFRRYVYNNLAEIQEILSLINCSVNFILYCIMSKQFRRTFYQVFCLSIKGVSENMRQRNKSSATYRTVACKDCDEQHYNVVPHVADNEENDALILSSNNQTVDK